MSALASIPTRLGQFGLLSPPLNVEEMGRRVRAARAYGGWTRAGDLAEAVGMGRNTLLKTEKGERMPKQWELWAIAELCGLPRSFFTDEWDLSEAPAEIDVTELEAAEEVAGDLDDERDQSDARSERTNRRSAS